MGTDARTNKLPALDAARLRARVQPADATQEVRAEDVLEALDVGAPRRAATAATYERAAVRASSAASLAPIAVEVRPPRPRPPEPSGIIAEMTDQFRAWTPPRRFRVIVEVVMAISLLIIAAAGVRARLAASETDDPVVAADVLQSSTGRVAASAPPQEPPVPQPAAPAPTTGTLTLGPGAKAMTVDNARISSASAVVPCGVHLVRVGNEKAHKVDVPCGGTVVLPARKR